METVIVVLDTRTLQTFTKSDTYWTPEAAQKAALQFAEEHFGDRKFFYRVWILAEVRYAFVLIQGRKT